MLPIFQTRRCDAGGQSERMRRLDEAGGVGVQTPEGLSDSPRVPPVWREETQPSCHEHRAVGRPSRVGESERAVTELFQGARKPHKTRGVPQSEGWQPNLGDVVPAGQCRVTEV